MRCFMVIIVLLLCTALGSVTYCQEQGAGDKYVSREEYRKLKDQHESLKQQMEALKTQIQELLQKGSPQAEAVKEHVQDLEKKTLAQRAETDQAIDELDKEVKRVKQMAKDSFPGTTRMLLGGYGSGTFMATRSGYGPATPLPPDSRDAKSSFSATFNPILLWKLSDRLIFEGEMELQLEGSET